MTGGLRIVGILVALATPRWLSAANVPGQVRPVMPLDGQWLLATDANNAGRREAWYQSPRPEAMPAKVPWIIQDAFPGYHGAVWYWRDFVPPANPHPDGRYLLRFWAVDYLAEVWLNGIRVGGHEGGETPFVLDVTHAIKANEKNRLAVRVLNPANEPIDGIVLAETARRCKVVPFACRGDFQPRRHHRFGGIAGRPASRVEDLWVIARPGSKTGRSTSGSTCETRERTFATGSLEDHRLARLRRRDARGDLGATRLSRRGYAGRGGPDCWIIRISGT